ncbi:MAG TPA: DUF4386 family protein [Dehalococcoidia bacterium]
MSDRWSRLAPLTGLVFVALLVAAFAISGSQPGVHKTGAQVISYYKAHHSRQMPSNYLAALGVVFLVFFAAALRSHLRRFDRAREFAALGFGGALLLALGIASFSSFAWALSDARNTLDPSAAQALNVLRNDFFWPLAIGLAVFMIGNGIAIARSRALPKWLGWIAFALGVLAMTPITFIAFLATFAWSLIVSVLLFVRGGGPSGAPAEASGAKG